MSTPFPADAVLGLAIETALKGTALLALAWLLTLAMRRASAAARHLVWSTALGALLALPVLERSLPSWRVVPMPARGGERLEAMDRRSAVEPPAVATDGGSSGTPAADPGAPAPPADPASDAPASRGSPAAPATRAPSLADILVAAWVLGVVAVFGAFVGGHLTLRRIVRDARPFDDADWLVLAQQCAARLALALPYALLRSPSTGMPLTFGLVHPRLLLPADAAGWPVERRRVVLLHELAHVQRRDCLTQAMAQLACALFWFHPAVWYAARRLRIEREHACDDRVLATETRASDYADHLMDVVRTRRAPALSALGAVAFARPSQLEGRLIAVLDPTRPRTGITPRLVARVAGFAAVSVLALATLAPAVRTDASRSPRDPGDAAPSAVHRAPDPSAPLEARVRWAFTEAARHGDRDLWIGYRLAPNPRMKGGVIGGDTGFDLRMLEGDWDGPTLDDLIDGTTAGARVKHSEGSAGPIAIFVRGTPGAGSIAVAHFRYHSSGLPVDLQRRPLYWLGEVDDPASIGWLRALANETRDGRIRSEVVEAVGIHQRSDLVVPDLTGRVHDDGSEHVRRSAVEGLSYHPSPEVEEILVRLARTDRSPEVRRTAAEALGRLGTPGAMNALVALTRASPGDEGVRQKAFDAFGQALAEDAKDSRTAEDRQRDQEVQRAYKEARALEKAERERAKDAGAWDQAETEVQRQAVQALGRFPEERSLPRLIELTDHPNPEVARQAVESIGMLRTDNSIAVLTRIMWRNPNTEVQRQAVEGMRFTDTPGKVLPELLRVARQHPARETRRQAAETLGRLDDPGVFDSLVALVRDAEDPEVARQAVESIGRLDAPAVMKTLAEIARTHPVPDVRRQAVEAMGRHDPDEALPYLEKILEGRGKN